MLSEISQTEKDKYYMISHIHGIFKIQKTNECIRKEASSQIQKNNKPVVTHREERGFKIRVGD